MVVDEPLVLVTAWLDAPDGDSAFDASACNASKACSICGPNCGVVAEVAAALDEEDEAPDEDEALDEYEPLC